MEHTNARKPFALVLALVLALAIPGSALAVETSATATETLGVNTTISLTGVPASLAYGNVNAGSAASAPAFDMVTSTNHANGFEVRVLASDLISGANTIARLNRSLAGVDAGTVAYSDNLAIVGTVAAGSKTSNIIMSVAVPSDAKPGAYTGSVTFTATTRP